MKRSIDKKKSCGFIHEFKKNKVLFLMMVPALLIIFVNNYMPKFGIFIAFKNIRYGRNIWETIFGSRWCGFRNFEYLFTSPDAFIITRNTVLFNFVFIAMGIVIPVSCAILLNELKNKTAAKFYQTVFFLPNFLSWVVVAYLGIAFLDHDMGFINKHILVPMGLDAILWYQQPKYWIFIIPVAQAWKSFGYGTVIYLAAISGFDSEYYEASYIDGASRWQQITSITIPLLKPMMVILTMLAIGRIFYSDFGLFYQFTLNSGLLAPVTSVLDTYVYRTYLVLSDIGMSSAAGFYQSVVGFILVFGSNLIVRKIDKDMALI